MVVREEPDERRRSSPVLREPEGEAPSGYSTYHTGEESPCG